MRNFLIKITSTFFYIGYLPFIPGTFGSLAGVFIFLLIKDNNFTYILISFIIIAIGLLASGEAERLFKRKDSPYIVIDEVGGMLLSLMFIPYSLRSVIIAFVLFRILDALKPYPAYRLERLKGGIGIMFDDIIAGLYTNILLQVILRLASFNTS